MLRALGSQDAVAEVVCFDWPLHDNPALDHSPVAAAAALSGMMARRYAADTLRAVVLLGAAEQVWLRGAVLDGLRCVETVSLHAALADGRSKARLWRDLAVLRH